MSIPSAITVRHGPLSDAEAVHRLVLELAPGYLSTFDQRIRNRSKSVVLVAYSLTRPVGYVLGFDDGPSVLYVWMAGVDPGFRQIGVLDLLMSRLEAWAKAEGFESLRLKTRNSRRQMLAFLVARRWMFRSVTEASPLEESEIVATKALA